MSLLDPMKMQMFLFFMEQLYVLYMDIMTLCVCYAELLSHVQLFTTPWTVACQAPLSMEFSRQEYWSGLPFPFLGDLPDPRIKPVSFVFPALADGFFTTKPLGK